MCGFEGQVGKRHQRSTRQALLGQCGAVVGESGNNSNPLVRKTSPSPQGGAKRLTCKRKGRKRKSRPRWACKGSALEHRISSIGSEIFSHSEDGLEGAEGSAHSQNINQQNGDVKKEQVKGCGSVNRPTPGSQRPAEPVAPGFLQGVKIPKNRGRFSVLGVKLWVVDARFSQRRAILYGVTIGVTAISCFEQGKQSARLSAEHNWRG